MAKEHFLHVGFSKDDKKRVEAAAKADHLDTTLGNEDRTRTPTASSGSICPRHPAWRAPPSAAATPSLSGSIHAPENVSTTEPQRSNVTYSAIKPCCTSKLILSHLRST